MDLGLWLLLLVACDLLALGALGLALFLVVLVANLQGRRRQAQERRRRGRL